MDVLIDIFAEVFGVATARNRHAGGTPPTPRFYQTKPVVIWANGGLSICGGGHCVDYRKMTTGFVFWRMLRRGQHELTVDGMDDVDMMDETRRRSGVATRRRRPADSAVTDRRYNADAFLLGSVRLVCRAVGSL